MSITVLDKEAMVDGVNYLSSLNVNLSKFLKSYNVPTLPVEKNYFWALCRSVIYQQISGKAAKKISDRYLSLYANGPRMLPSEVIDIDIEKIFKVGISRQKASYIKNIAHAFNTKIIDEKNISKLDDQEIISQLKTIKGVGRWTAEMFLIFTLRRSDIFPVTDLGVQKGFKIFYSLDDLPTIELMIKKSESWKPYRTIMSLYLWYAVEGPFEW